jgi:predicted permease
LFRRYRREQELDEEVQAHLRMAARERMDQGETTEQARTSAAREFGNVTLVKEVARDMWGFRWLETLLQDLRYGTRTLRKNPGFTAVAVLTLALGIGMNTALFSLVNAVLLRPLTYPDADRLAWLSDYDYKYGFGDNWVAPGAYVLWKDQAHSFERMIAYGNQDLALISAGESTQERIASITDGFWGIAAARPELGRLFAEGEPDVMVLSHALFERRFGSDPRVIGKVVSLNGHEFTVVGVLPRDFRFLFPQQTYSGDERRAIDAYIPLPRAALSFWQVTMPQWEAVTNRVGPVPHALCVVGKLKPNIAIEAARAEMEPIYARVAQEHYPSWQREFIRLDVTSLKEKLVGGTRSALMVLFGAVGFVLLIAGANVANLLLARASTRRREIATRAAMGAGRARLVSQCLVESVLLALIGGAAGLALARWALAIIARLGSEVIPRAGQANIDSRVLVYTLVVSFATGVFFGLGPALSMARGNLHDALRDERRTSSPGIGRIRVHGVLVAAGLALAIVLLVGAGLMLKSFWRMTIYPSGFDPQKLLVMQVSLYGSKYDAWLQKDAYIRELLGRIQAVPGVKAAGVQRATLNTDVKVEGASPLPSGKGPFAAVRAVSTGYLRAMGVPIVKGQWPREDSFDTFLVNEAFVHEALPNRDPIGRHLSGALMSGTIVGVVADFKDWQLDAEPSPEVYVPYQLPPMGRSVRVAVRTSGDPRPIEPIILRLVSGVDPTQPVYEFGTLEQALSSSIAPRRFNLFLLEIFAATAVLMALVGIYGVVAYSVSRRTHEIGIRMALGATPGDVLSMMVGQGSRLTLTGVGIGIVGALGLTRFLASLLYGVKPTDPLTFIIVSLILAAVALLASCVPARRATKVDPMVALRYE